MKVIRGLELRVVAGDPRFDHAAAWFSRLVHGPTVEILAFDGAAAEAAGQILARAPLPATGRLPREKKATRRARWILDVQIASTAWVHGHEVMTENNSDFDAIAHVLMEIYPSALELTVSSAPR